MQPIVDKLLSDLASMTQNIHINLEKICTSFIDGFVDFVHVHAPLKIFSRRQYLNKLTFIKRLAKEHYCTSQLLNQKQDISKQWSRKNELLDQNKRCSSSTIHKLTTKDDENIESKSKISNTLNDYFVNVGVTLSVQAGTGSLQASFTNKIPPNMHFYFFQPIVPVEVYQVIQNQKSKKAAGPENIPI